MEKRFGFSCFSIVVIECSSDWLVCRLSGVSGLLERASEANSLTSVFELAGKRGCIMVSRMLIDRRVHSATFLSV